MSNRNLYFITHKYITAVFTDECIDLYPQMSSCWGGENLINERTSCLLPCNHHLYEKHIVKPKNEIAWIYRKRFGRVLRTSLRLDRKKSNLYFMRKLLGYGRKVENEYFILSFDKKRKYVAGNTVMDKIASIKDIEAIKKELEIFTGYVLTYFQVPNSRKLRNDCYDVALANAIVTKDNGYYFFDFEFIMKGGVDPSYLLYRIIRNSHFKEEEKRPLYAYLCDKFIVQNTWNFWDYYHDLTEKTMLLPPKKIKLSFGRAFLRKVIRLASCFCFYKRLRYRFRENLMERYAKTHLEIFKFYFG